MGTSVKTIDQLMKDARFRDSFKVLPKGNTYKDLSTVIIIPTPGNVEEKGQLNCKKCKHKNEYTTMKVNGLDPRVVESWKRIIKPMNVPVIEMMVNGHEVGEAYNQAIEHILSSPGLKNFKYILTLEHDNLPPFADDKIKQGPLMALYEGIAKGYDVVGGLYWTKGTPSAPLIYGDPKQVETKTNKPTSGMFKVRMDWKDGDLVECNGMGMGFTLFKTEIFKDKRIEKPWFKTAQGIGEGPTGEPGMAGYTQDLFFFQKARALGYKVAVDTRVKVGHLSFADGIIY